MGATRRTSGASGVFRGKRQFQHWYRDNQVYFITVRCRARFPAFASEDAKAIFWAQFEKYTASCGFTPWVTSLLDNHYHTMGYLLRGEMLAPMMQGIQGAVAKLVNDVLQRECRAGRGGSAAPGVLNGSGRLVPFWRESKRKNYFDGCLRDERQGRLCYRYVLAQGRRHGIVADPAAYLHTRVGVELERAIARANELGAWLEGVRYRRYERG